VPAHTCQNRVIQVDANRLSIASIGVLELEIQQLSNSMRITASRLHRHHQD
jgi:hypothetical protein